MKTIDFATGQIGEAGAKLIGHYGSEADICRAARVSYGVVRKNKRTDEELLIFLLENGHLSPFEMASLHFDIKAPIYVARQIMRHRTGKYSERSLRYSVTTECEYIDDKQIGSQQMNALNKEACLFYHANVQSPIREEYKLPREIARKVLPLCVMTKFEMQIDLRNFMNFLEQRMSEHAQFETRCYAREMYNHAERLFPTVMKWFSKNRNNDLVTEN